MTQKKGVILSGMRPTGRLHIGHLSVLENWARLQEDYESFHMIADWHALTSDFDDTSRIDEYRRELILDYLAGGLDPDKTVIFIQSHVKAHAELTLLLGMSTPIPWLERVPTYKDQIQQFNAMGKDINTYGFLGYPLLMAADIIIYRAGFVPVGEDQGVHLEFARELVRRFHYMYNTSIFPEPMPVYSKIPMLPGIDGRKMSKSYRNDISLSASTKEINEKVHEMVTDPARIRKTDPGHPEVCIVNTYHKIYNEDAEPEISEACRGGRIGCVECKKRLAAILDNTLAPVRERRDRYAGNVELMTETLRLGAEKANARAEETMELVRGAMRI